MTTESQADLIFTAPAPAVVTDGDPDPGDDGSPLPRAELRAADATVRFMLAGNAHVTFQSKKTEARFTYRVTKAEPRDGDTRTPPHFVSVLTAPDTYQYLGCIFNQRRYAFGRKSRMAPTAPSNKAFEWVWSKLSAGVMPADLAVYHEGRCGRCGRRLTTPESIESGLGPICAKRGES